ncbi:MAG: hypothetical protein PHW91_04520 [Bacteroidales bacterium]|nr:hypothetical protein [Bacteroidales bacterium]
MLGGRNIKPVNYDDRKEKIASPDTERRYRLSADRQAMTEMGDCNE